MQNAIPAKNPRNMWQDSLTDQGAGMDACLIAKMSSARFIK